MDARDSVAGNVDVAKKLTYADFLLFPDDGQRHELIDGEHYVTPSPNKQHQQLSVRLTVALGNYFTRTRSAKSFTRPSTA